MNKALKLLKIWWSGIVLTTKALMVLVGGLLLIVALAGLIYLMGTHPIIGAIVIFLVFSAWTGWLFKDDP